MSITFKLYGYAGKPEVQVRFDAEGDGIKTINYDESQSFGIFGTLGQSKCTMSWGFGVLNRDFHLQPMIGNKNRGEELYKINTVTGGISGKKTSLQTSKFFKVDDKDYVMNYGVSHASDEKPAPLSDQAYLYLSETNPQWMGLIAMYNPKVGRLVLPGAHDAGMWKIDETFLAGLISGAIAISAITRFIPFIGWIIAAGGFAISACIKTILYNVSVTQKDSTSDLLRMGIRHFDFRPAKFKALANKVVHVHSVIPGGSFDEFLDQINKFLEQYPTQVVFVEIKADGIVSDIATFISKDELIDIATKKLKIPFQVYEGSEISTLNDTHWNALKGEKPHEGLVVFMYKVNTGTSYSDGAYGASMTDPKFIDDAVKGYMSNIVESKFNLIQTQNTATIFLANHWTEFAKHPSWYNDIALSDTGSLLADTKALFDATLYRTLASESTKETLKNKKGLTAIVNDFADIALVDLSIALTWTRMEKE